MAPQVNKLLGQIGNALFPNYCCLCQWHCSGQLPLCAGCRQELTANRRSCRRCALPLPDETTICGQCLQEPPDFDRVIAPWLYCEYLAYMLWRWKFNSDLSMTPLLADLWLSTHRPEPIPDAVCPIPLHWWRQWRRGYNQSELLARQLALSLPGLKMDNRLLKRQRATPPQSAMGARQRSLNLRGAFTVTGACDNLRVALVDDVLTTGATAREAARTLKQAGAAEVEIWCLARTPPPQ